MLDDMKAIGLAGVLLTMLFSWTWYTINKIDEKMWTSAQQTEYRRGIDRELSIMNAEITRLRGACEDPDGLMHADSYLNLLYTDEEVPHGRARGKVSLQTQNIYPASVQAPLRLWGDVYP